MSEFSRPFDTRRLPEGSQRLEANEAECAALAARFGLVAVRHLVAEMKLSTDGPAVRAEGRLRAQIVQSCAVSGEDLPVLINEQIALRFVPQVAVRSEEEEIEFDPAECDEIEMNGGQFDLGEALAQSLALAIDPYATGPGAEAARQKAGLLGDQATGPFAALSSLRKPVNPSN